MFRKSPTCFLISVYSEQAAGIRDLIKEICEQVGVELISVDTASYTSSITGDIAEAIERADLVIADLTGGTPNVFFELGIAHGMRKRILPISQDRENIPLDLAGIRFLFYRPDDTEKLRHQIREWIEESMQTVRPSS
jgi:nucleoside 2-deoxyribosyltransferase